MCQCNKEELIACEESVGHGNSQPSDCTQGRNDNTPKWIAEGRDPTPEEWIGWFYSLSTEEEAVEVAKQVIENARHTYHCFLMDYQGRAE
jgi:hypothetical protein